MPTLKKKSLSQRKSTNRDQMRHRRSMRPNTVDGLIEKMCCTKSSPVVVQVDSSPVIVQADSSPVIVQADSSPVIVQADSSPVIRQADSSPVIVQADSSPVIVQADSSPVIVQANSSPVIVQADTNDNRINRFNESAHEHCFINLLGYDCEDFTDFNANENLYTTPFKESATQSSEQNPLYTATPLYGKVYETPTEKLNIMKPFNSNLFILGSFHQGDERFNKESRGSQCTMNALCSLVYAKYCDIITKDTVDKVLLAGDQLYIKVLLSLKQKGIFRSRLLSFDEIPNVVSVMDKLIHVEKSDVISGVCTQEFATLGLPELYQSLYTVFEKYSAMLLMTGSICSAIFRKDNEYCLFDSHSHGSNGLSHAEGSSVLISFHCLEDVVTFIYAMYSSMMIDISAQFDILPVNLIEILSNTQKQTESKTDTVFAQKKKEATEWKSVLNKKIKVSNNKGLFNSKTENFKNETSAAEANSRSYSSEDKHVTLIGRYFKDQMKKDKCKNISKQKKDDRRLYQRAYKQKQREHQQFKESEKEIKRQKREYDENKVKEKQSSLKCKRNSRTSEEFKRKERDAKRTVRESDDNKVKEKQTTLQTMRNLRTSEQFKIKERDAKRTVRESADNKVKEKQSTLKCKRNSRTSEEFKRKERDAKRTVRESDDNKVKEKQTTLQTMRNLRMSEQFKIKERDAKRTVRESADNKVKEKQSTLKCKRNSRTSEEFKRKERDAKRTVRESDDNKVKEKQTTLQTMRNLRMSEQFKIKERDAKRTVRESDDNKVKEKQSTLQTMRNLRTSEQFKIKERDAKRTVRESDENKVKDNQSTLKTMRNLRTSYQFKLKEIESQNKSKRKARSDHSYKEKEMLSKQIWRSNKRNKTAETIFDCQRKAHKRQNSDFCHNEKNLAKRRKYGCDMSSCINLFHKSISVGPVYICSCCHQTWFKQSVSDAKVLSEEQKAKFLTQTLSVENKEWICTTCKNNIFSGKTPKLSVLNGMQWAPIPTELDLFPLEERLIALRIPFMQIRELPRGRQLSLKGNVVNVPVDIQPVITALPRPFDENVTVAVKLKKKLSFKSCAFSENVRPLRVLVALHWLKKNSELYRNTNVQIDEEWVKNVTQNSIETVHEFLSPESFNTNGNDSHEKLCNLEESCNNSMNHNSSQSDSGKHVTDDLYDSDVEEDTTENVGNIDTMLDDANIENRNCTFTFAPGEGQQPLSIYQDKDSECLCFPSIFCGQTRKENQERIVPVHYSDIAKWELRSQDRRAANSVPNIFFKLKKIQMKQLNDKVNLAVRRCQSGKNKLTVADVRNSDTVNSIVKKDEGYYLFKQLRNSPAYLETRKKDIFAMIRQLGLPTWFVSLSSADTRWTDLLTMLASLNKNVNYNAEEIGALTWEQKIKLIQSDPVTCSRYFDHRVQEFINIVLKSEHEPLGHITDYFYRVEFQQRGSPHIHMVIWVENAPKFKVNSDEQIISYVNQYLHCSSNEQAVGNLVDLQIHKHSRTCRKKQDKLCRFGYPLPPLPKTMILEPLETDKDKYSKLYQQLQKKINDQKQGYGMSYEMFLDTVVCLSEEDYIKCIRSSLNSSKVFLKREPCEIRVNLYNNTVLQAWKANIDIQFVLDPYACAMYIVSYISKSQRGMSNLLYAAAKEARNGNLDIKRQVRHIGNVFSNSVEVSAQEAVYLVLQMPLTKGTRDVVFINTSTAGDRVQLLKPKSVLEELPDGSTDVVADNVIKRYSKRPKALENYCLADYVSQLDIHYPDKESECSQNEEINDDDIEKDEGFHCDQTVLKLRNGMKIKKRSNAKVIRYVRFNHKSDEENHFREKLLLFFPWRNEETDLLGNFATYKQHYESLKEDVDKKCLIYEHHMEELEIARNMAEADQDAYDEIAPNAQQTEAETAEEDINDSETFVHFNPDRVSEHRHYDIGIEIGCSTSSSQVSVNENILPDDQYRSLLRSLNREQRHFHDHVVHWIKTKDAPLHAFLSGGAGVGKSVVIRALYQSLFKYLNLKEGENTDDVRVLLCAYTGKAAFNIGGSTISSAFKQKYKQSNQTLTCDSLNSYRSKYRSLSVVIIDEISMVGNAMLSFIDQRLQELKGTRSPFGGVSVIAVGDLYQLKPINGDWIFNDMTSNAAALASNLWKEHFTMFELKQVMRQKDDLAFAQLLNRLRKDELTEDDKRQLQKREIDKNCSNYMLNEPHLFAENFFMHSFNDSIINNMETEKVVIPCHDSVVSPKLSKERQNEAILKLPTDPNKTANLHCSLTVVVDMIYDLTVNVNTEDGLANGASCIIKNIEYKQTETNRPSIIWVQFDDAKAGIETRTKFKNRQFYHANINESWTPVFDTERSFTYNKKTFQRIQFPLQPSAGRSVHRAQGSTLEKAVIDLSQRKTRKIPHLHYVALSRVKSLSNLQILNFNEQALKVDNQVVNEMERLQQSSMLDLCFVPFDLVDATSHIKLSFNNSRSLHRHFEDIKHGYGLLSSHAFGLAESRLYQLDQTSDYMLEGYTLIRNDQSSNKVNVRPPHGLAIYIKDICKITSQVSFTSKNFEFVKVNIIHSNEVQFVVLYKAPSMSGKDFSSIFLKELIPHVDTSKPFVIMGDFNLDIYGKHRNILRTICEGLSCKLGTSGPTTDNGSTLDLILSNMDGTYGTMETYWEKPLAMYIFSHNPAMVQKLLDSCTSGGSSVNDCLMQAGVPTLPFGGVGNSGIGAYHGKFSFETFSHKRSVMHREMKMESVNTLRYPPFTEKKENIICWLQKKNKKKTGLMLLAPWFLFGTLFAILIKVYLGSKTGQF